MGQRSFAGSGATRDEAIHGAERLAKAELGVEDLPPYRVTDEVWSNDLNAPTPDAIMCTVQITLEDD